MFKEPKSGRERVVRIPKAVAAMLVDHMDTYTGPSPDALVFGVGTDQAMNLVRFREDELKPALSAAGIDPAFRIHDMRHTCVAILIRQNVHPKLVQEQLGHSSFKVTMDLYGHMYDADSEKTAGALDTAFGDGEAAVEPATISGHADNLLTKSTEYSDSGSDSEDDGWAEMRAVQGL